MLVFEEDFQRSRKGTLEAGEVAEAKTPGGKGVVHPRPAGGYWRLKSM